MFFLLSLFEVKNTSPQVKLCLTFPLSKWRGVILTLSESGRG